MSRKQPQIQSSAKIAMLAVIFGVPIGAIALGFGGRALMSWSPVLFIGILIIGCAVVTAYTSKLMYEFYDTVMPITSYIPCIGECSLVELIYRRICYIFYVIALACGIVNLLPYGALSFLGIEGSTVLKVVTLWLAIICLLAVQIVKGIGMCRMASEIESSWFEFMRTDTGVIKNYKPFFFIPFVRALAIYSINKPLSTMVKYMGVSADEYDDEVYVEDEDEEEDYDDNDFV